MGKYIRKAKTAGEVVVMEVSQASLGVRTRARTLALQRLQKSSASPPAARHKQQLTQQQGSKKDNCEHNPNPNSNSRVRVSSGSDSGKKKEGEVGSQDIVQEDNGNDNVVNYSNTVNNNNEINDFGGIEASFGENILDIEVRERGTRESTPCSLIRNPENIRTPGSTTRPTSSAVTNQRVQNSTMRNIPTSNEMDEFFSLAEVDQQRQFIEKYNFDPVKDRPLPGRYQWEKVDA
ncbi:hypothetical protein V6N12_017691 [Hibiscus sabdariffa]|uniref:Cyclin-dependent kinase inhibitor domain-containing protein n=1 Tax=Hibiscus sabdariffa TaxID=183260 RepID=A0ABR2CGA7_9ROSI